MVRVCSTLLHTVFGTLMSTTTLFIRLCESLSYIIRDPESCRRDSLKVFIEWKLGYFGLLLAEFLLKLVVIMWEDCQLAVPPSC